MAMTNTGIAQIDLLQNPETFLPALLLNHPSMISDKEKWQLFEAAAAEYQGEGRIVDAGIFLGGSTMCFGLGLEENDKKEEILARWPKPIVSFEQALINPGMFKHFDRYNLKVKGKVGDSFAPTLRKLIAPVLDKVDLHIGDITKTTWSKDEPIEILFLDVIKTPAINEFVIKTFFPQLIPGKSLVIQQDYFLDLLPYLKVGQEYFSDYFEFVSEIGPTAVFRLIKEIPAEKLQGDPSDFLSIKEQLKLVDQAAHRAKSDARQFCTALSKVHIVGDKLGGRDGLKELDRLVAKYPDQAPGKTQNISTIKKYQTAFRRMSNTAGMASMHEYLADSVPESTAETPGYLTILERRYLHGLARDYYQGNGSIVDLAPLLGASTLSLGLGLSENDKHNDIIKASPTPIKCFEFSELNAATLGFLKRNGKRKAPTAKTLITDFNKNTAQISSILETSVSDVCQWDLQSLNAIEILHIDRLNNANDFLSAYNASVPKLIEGAGILILRNYFHDQFSHIKVIHERHAKSFEYVGANRNTAIFKFVKPLSSKKLSKNPNIGLPAKKQAKLIKRAAKRTWLPLYNLQARLSGVNVLLRARESKKAAKLLKSIEQAAAEANFAPAEQATIDRAIDRSNRLAKRFSQGKK